MQILSGHTTEENAKVINDYPYGFRLRTRIRYWIESNKNGDRFISQTLNPKTNLWNNPKKGTYSDVIVMVEEENGYISYIEFSTAYRETKDLNDFLEKVKGFEFNDFQKHKLLTAKAILKVRENISFEIVANPTEEEIKEIEENKKKNMKIINRAFTIELDKAKKEGI